jgi:hypothetical protein
VARGLDVAGVMRLAIVLLLVSGTAGADEFAFGIRAQAEKVTASDAPDTTGVELSGGELLVRWRFWPHWGLEASLGSVSGSTPGYDRRSESVLLTGQLHLTPGHLYDLYLFLGIGGEADHITSGAYVGAFKESEMRLGAGLEWRWEHVGVGAELAGIGLGRIDKDRAMPLDPVPAKSGGVALSVVVGYYVF